MDLLIFYIVLAVALCVSGVIVFYFARHNPNPRLRPKAGEVLLVSIIAGGLSLGASYLMATILGSGADVKEQIGKYRYHEPKEKPKGDSGPTSSGRGKAERGKQ